MNKGWYKTTGWILIITGILLAVYILFNSICIQCIERGYAQFDFVYELFIGLLLGALIFVLSFFPGRFYLKIYDKKKENKLIKWSLISVLVAFLVFIIYLLIGFYNLTIGTPDLYLGMGWIFVLFFVWPLGILYGITIFLLVINWFKNR